jgi:hypothetical protein
VLPPSKAHQGKPTKESLFKRQAPPLNQPFMETLDVAFSVLPGKPGSAWGVQCLR